ncbi:MAG: hypothetical protein JSV19_00995 [Phycisphaerales bacterium]|nr:MAG: hypothetical protein JSV19_00995 [Phycisphaerales bacterium]
MSPLTTLRRGGSLLLVVPILWSTSFFAGAYAINSDAEAAPPETAPPGVHKRSGDVPAGAVGERGSAKADEDTPGPCDDVVGWYRLA